MNSSLLAPRPASLPPQLLGKEAFSYEKLLNPYSIDSETEALTFINQETTQGRTPVHLSGNPGNRFIAVSRQLTSSLAVLEAEQELLIMPAYHWAQTLC